MWTTSWSKHARRLGCYSSTGKELRSFTEGSQWSGIQQFDSGQAHWLIVRRGVGAKSPDIFQLCNAFKGPGSPRQFPSTQKAWIEPVLCLDSKPDTGNNQGEGFPILEELSKIGLGKGASHLVSPSCSWYPVKNLIGSGSVKAPRTWSCHSPAYAHQWFSILLYYWNKIQVLITADKAWGPSSLPNTSFPTLSPLNFSSSRSGFFPVPPTFWSLSCLRQTSPLPHLLHVSSSSSTSQLHCSFLRELPCDRWDWWGVSPSLRNAHTVLSTS